MQRPLKLIQMSDLHLRADTDAIVRGWPVEQAWRRVADDAVQRHPDADLWVLTGDLIDDESVAGYQRLDARLAALNCPVLALAGNHDDPAAMRRCLSAARVHATVELGTWRIHALNSHIDGSAAGRIGTPQLDRLRVDLARHGKPTLICMHHPPVAVGSRWLDAIGLHDRDAFCDLVREQPHVAGLLCGHAHQALTARVGHAPCWITPSTMRQFLPGADDFAVDHESAPGYRVIALHADGRVTSAVQRVESGHQ